MLRAPPTCCLCVLSPFDQEARPHQPARPHLAREEIEQLRRSIAMLQPGSMAMKRVDAMRLLGDLGEVRGRLDRLCHGLRTLLADEDASPKRGDQRSPHPDIGP